MHRPEAYTVLFESVNEGKCHLKKKKQHRNEQFTARKKKL